MNYYETHAKSLAARYERADVTNVQELLAKTFPPKSNLLELGCGSGRDASFMLKHGCRITAVDASAAMIDEAKKLHPELTDHLHVKNISDDLGVEPESFDGVYSIAALMHLDEHAIAKSIENVYTVLKPNGLFLFSVSIERDDIDEQGKDAYGRHFTTLTQEQWESTCAVRNEEVLLGCKKIGFKIIQTVLSSDGLDREGIVWFTCILRKSYKD